jgi:glutamine amidotransferase
MCRLFGFRSVITSQVHRSLVSADNALMRQSEQHPDGWGVAYYVDGYPHVVKSVATAVSDSLFRRVSGVVSSETVLAHLRKATVGQLSIINSHPFQFGNWIFAHNGQIPNFDQYRDALLEKVSPIYRRYILGDTDSEVLFYLLISNMARFFDVHRKGTELEEMISAVKVTVDEVREVTGMDCYCPKESKEEEFYLTFVLTNGHMMLAHQGGKELYFSTYKESCPERASCPSFSQACEAATSSGFVNHFIVSSEPLHGENIWLEMAHGDVAAVDWRMRLKAPQAAMQRVAKVV